MTGGINKCLVKPLIIMLLLTACNNNVVFTDSKSIPSEQWSLDNVPTFNTNITDTIVSNNISFTIRTGTSYPYSNIYLFITTVSPAGKSITDTLQYMLADYKGKWFGRGFGDIHELNLPYRTGVYFPVKGNYTFKIQHGMRNEVLKGVYDIGIRIERRDN